MLTTVQAGYIYKKVEQKGIVNVNTSKQEIEEDRLNNNYIDNKEEINPYCNIIINEHNREKALTSQMEQWSILRNVFNYVQYDRNPRFFIIKMLWHWTRKIIGRYMVDYSKKIDRL